MTNGLSKPLTCVSMRNGVEIWVENERAETLQTVLGGITQHKFIRFGDQTFNTADIVGVFQASTMEAATRRKNGQTQCKEGAWHDRNEKCDCVPRKTRERHEQIAEAIKACGKCVAGFVTLENGSAARCECIAAFSETV